jgi:hypothetical protein
MNTLATQNSLFDKPPGYLQMLGINTVYQTPLMQMTEIQKPGITINYRIFFQIAGKQSFLIKSSILMMLLF